MLVDRHESPLGRWEMAWSDPDPRLRAFVRRYAGYLEITPAPLRRGEFPPGDVHFIISFGPPWDLPDPTAPDPRSERHGSFVAGLDDRHAFSEHAGFAHVADAPLPPREVAWAWGRLVQSGGAVAVGDLATDLGWSRKRLIGRFREHVGVAPK